MLESSIYDMSRQDINNARILQAAVTCFEKYGIAKTTMEDIAQAAGLGRKTVYRAYSTRTRLLETLAWQRVSVLVDAAKAVVDDGATLEDAVVKGTIESLRLVRGDAMFMALLADSNDRGVEQHLLDPDSPFNDAMMSVWKDAFKRARSSGEWRKGLTNREAIEWLRSTQVILLLRADLTPQGQENFLKRFVMPALLKR